jgi:hypothetical protein
MSKHEIYRTTVLSDSYWSASTNKKLLNSTLSQAVVLDRRRSASGKPQSTLISRLCRSPGGAESLRASG